MKRFLRSALVAAAMTCTVVANAAPSAADLTPGRYFVMVYATSFCRLQPTGALAESLRAMPAIVELGNSVDTGRTPDLEQLPCADLAKLPGALPVDVRRHRSGVQGH